MARAYLRHLCGPGVLDVAMFALREAARAAQVLEAERGVRVPWSPTLRDVADLPLRPLGSPVFEALRLLERAVLTADAQAREETDRAMWSGLARAALRAGQASSPLPCRGRTLGGNEGQRAVRMRQAP